MLTLSTKSLINNEIMIIFQVIVVLSYIRTSRRLYDSDISQMTRVCLDVTLMTLSLSSVAIASEVLSK